MRCSHVRNYVLWMLTSLCAFDLLYTGRGLSADNVCLRFIATAERSLFR